MTERQIDHVALTVRDLPGMTDFYETVIGLTPEGGDGATRRLGAGGRTLIELRGDPSAQPRDPRQAGLFHTAFLLPSRADLGGWLRHASGRGVRLTGASDHGVSEALYLDDPEGNGIEIYRDRPSGDWHRDGDRVEMFTRRLDRAALAADAAPGWTQAPAGSRIGHVHMQVGDLDAAAAFFADDLGLHRTSDGQGGIWYAWDGYHHHLAGNVWNSRRAGPRPDGMAGLAEIVVADASREGRSLQDPWGSRFRFV